MRPALPFVLLLLATPAAAAPGHHASHASPGNQGAPGLTDRIATLEAELGSAHADLAASEAESTTLQAEVTALQELLGASEAALAAAENSVGALTLDLAALQVELSELIEVTELARVPRTGQTTCWDADHEVVDCAGTGQDGELQAGLAPPTVRFTDNQDGTVTDNFTGLIWLHDVTCIADLPFDSALYAARLLASGACGLSDGSVSGDWRVPNVREMVSLLDYDNLDSALPTGHPFDGLRSTHYWTSTTVQMPTDLEGWINAENGEAFTVVVLSGSVIGRDKSTEIPFFVVRD